MLNGEKTRLLAAITAGERVKKQPVFENPQYQHKEHFSNLKKYVGTHLSRSELTLCMSQSHFLVSVLYY